MSNNLLRGIFLLLGLMVLCIHVYAWLTPNDIFYTAFPSFDKIEHLLSGFVIGGLLCVTLKKPVIIDVLLLVLSFGIVWELLETGLGYDSMDDVIYDLIFNELGALIGGLLMLKK